MKILHHQLAQDIFTLFADTVQELKDGTLGAVKGQVKCADALNKQEYWVD